MKRSPLLTLNRSWLAVLVFLFLPGLNLPPNPGASQTVTQGKTVLAAPARPGDLDTTFGDQGIVQADPGGAVAIQFDGKIIVAGSLNGDFALARYTKDGSLDPSFGSSGRVVTDFDGRADYVGSVAIQPDGKIVAAGSIGIIGLADYGGYILARYNPDGSLDPSFGESGKVLPDQEGLGGFRGIGKVVLQPDGKIIAGGSALRAYYEDVVLARFNQDGSLDTTFGNLGSFILQVEDSARLSDMLVEPDGRIVVVGAAAGKYTRTRPAFLARFAPDGSLVHLIRYDFPLKHPTGNIHYNEASGVTWQSGGKLVVVGNTSSFPPVPNELSLARFTGEGILDTSFGDGGFSNLSAPSETWGLDIQVQSDGKLLVCGNIENEYGGIDFMLARFTPDGELDPTFGEGGLSRVDANRCYGCAVFLLRDGRILLAGMMDEHFILSRLLNDVPALVPRIWFPMVGHP